MPCTSVVSSVVLPLGLGISSQQKNHFDAESRADTLMKLLLKAIGALELNKAATGT